MLRWGGLRKYVAMVNMSRSGDRSYSNMRWGLCRDREIAPTEEGWGVSIFEILRYKK